MTTSFASALTAARDAAASQHYPQGALYVVATPIGNLADISLRALHVLQIVDCIACEDTRHTQGMLRSYGLERPGSQLLSVHQHNEAEAAQQVIERLQQGQRIAYVSDAGTPGVSDPGARLCAALQAVGLRSIPLPGASSVTSAISVAGAIAHNLGQLIVATLVIGNLKLLLYYLPFLVLLAIPTGLVVGMAAQLLIGALKHQGLLP